MNSTRQVKTQEGAETSPTPPHQGFSDEAPPPGTQYKLCNACKHACFPLHADITLTHMHNACTCLFS